LLSVGGSTTTLVVSGNLTQTQGNFTPPATLNVTGNVTLTAGTFTAGTNANIGGDWTNNGATFTPGAGTVTFSGSNKNIGGSSATSFASLTLSGIITSSQNFSVSSIMTVNGTFTPAATDIVSGTGTLTGSGTVNVTRTAATADFSSQYTIAAATLTNLTVRYSGASAQTLSALTYGSLTIANASGVTSAGAVTVNTTLTLTSGNITTGANTVTIGSSGTVSRTSGHIVGKLEKTIPAGSPTPTFEIGDASYYTPVNLSFASVTLSNTVTVSTTSIDHPNIGTSDIDVALSVNRYWTVTNNGVTFGSASATFNFDNADLDGGATPTVFIIGRYNGGWTLPTVGTLTSNSSQATGLTAFGDFQVGELALVTWDGGASTSNWGDANNWNPNGVPTSTKNVSLNGISTIDVNVAATTKNLTLDNASLLLTILAGNSITVSGNYSQLNGSLNIETAFPSVTGSVTISGGTVSYTKSGGSQNVSGQTYNNLTISGSGTKVAVGGITVVGDLTIGAGNTFNDDGYQIIGNASGALSVAAGSTLSLGNASTGTSFPTNFVVGNITLNSTSTVAYNSDQSQNIAALNYGNLTSTGTGARTLPAGQTVGVAGTFTNGTNSYTTASSTVDYNGTASQNIATMTYNNLTVSGAGTSTLLGITPIDGDLTVSGGTIDLSTFTANRTSSGGTFTLAAACTIRVGQGSSLPASFTTTNYDPTSVIEFYGTAQTVSAGTYQNINITSTGGTVTLGGNVSVVGDLTITNGTLDLSTFTANRSTSGGTLSIGSGGTLKIGGGNAMPINYGTYAFDPASTVEYSGNNQTIDVFNFGNLTVSASGTTTLPSGSTVGISGTFTPGGGAYITTGNTIEYNLNGAQTVAAFSYNNLTLSTGGAKAFAGGTTTITGTLSITGATADALTNSSIIEYSSSGAQTVTPMTYFDLTFTGGGTKTIFGVVTANNNVVTNTGSVIVIDAAGTLVIHGDLDNSGNFTNNGILNIVP